MKETDDGKIVGVADAGSTPATSTKYSSDWYYTENEWSRLGMQGPLPPERNKQLLTNEHGGEMDFDGASELLQEDSNTNFKRQR